MNIIDLFEIKWITEDLSFAQTWLKIKEKSVGLWENTLVPVTADSDMSS